MERLAHGKSPFAADKNHFHHKLMRRGLYHNEAVMVIYALQAILVISAFTFRFYPEGVLLWSYLIFSSLILFGFFLTERTGWELKRSSFVDFSVKGRLRFFKDRRLLIVFSFRLLQMAMPALSVACQLFSGSRHRSRKDEGGVLVGIEGLRLDRRLLAYLALGAVLCLFFFLLVFLFFYLFFYPCSVFFLDLYLLLHFFFFFYFLSVFFFFSFFFFSFLYAGLL